MQFKGVVNLVAELLKEFDSERPVHKFFKPGIGPFGEPQIVREIGKRMSRVGLLARTRRHPDLEIGREWALEFKIVRPFGDNGKEAENWSVNLLHPYEGNVSLMGDAFRLSELKGFEHKGLIVIGYEHDPAKICLDPLCHAFELIATRVLEIVLCDRVEEKRRNLVHPEHQVLRCMGWELRPK